METEELWRVVDPLVRRDYDQLPPDRQKELGEGVRGLLCSERGRKSIWEQLEGGRGLKGNGRPTFLRALVRELGGLPDEVVPPTDRRKLLLFGVEKSPPDRLAYWDCLFALQAAGDPLVGRLAAELCRKAPKTTPLSHWLRNLQSWDALPRPRVRVLLEAAGAHVREPELHDRIRKALDGLTSPESPPRAPAPPTAAKPDPPPSADPAPRVPPPPAAETPAVPPAGAGAARADGAPPDDKPAAGGAVTPRGDQAGREGPPAGTTTPPRPEPAPAGTVPVPADKPAPRRQPKDVDAGAGGLTDIERMLAALLDHFRVPRPGRAEPVSRPADAPEPVALRSECDRLGAEVARLQKELARAGDDLRAERDRADDLRRRLDRAQQAADEADRRAATAEAAVEDSARAAGRARDEALALADRLAAADARHEDAIRHLRLEQEGAVHTFRAQAWGRLRSLLVEVLGDAPDDPGMTADQRFLRDRLRHIRDRLQDLGIPPDGT